MLCTVKRTDIREERVSSVTISLPQEFDKSIFDRFINLDFNLGFLKQLYQSFLQKTSK